MIKCSKSRELKLSCPPPEKTIMNNNKSIVRYRSMYMPTKKIGITPEKETEKSLETRSRRYGYLELGFATEEVAYKNKTSPPKTEKRRNVYSLSTYQGRRIARVRNGKVPSEIEEVWSAAAVLIETSEDVKIMQAAINPATELDRLQIRVNFTNHRRNCKRYSKKSDEVRLTVMVEGKTPTCYGCSQKEHIRRMCSSNFKHELTDSSEVASTREDAKQEKAELEHKDCYLSEEEYTEVTKRKRERIDPPSKEKKNIKKETE